MSKKHLPSPVNENEAKAKKVKIPDSTETHASALLFLLGEHEKSAKLNGGDTLAVKVHIDAISATNVDLPRPEETPLPK
jgi:hypothetical protein